MKSEEAELERRIGRLVDSIPERAAPPLSRVARRAARIRFHRTAVYVMVAGLILASITVPLALLVPLHGDRGPRVPLTSGAGQGPSSPGIPDVAEVECDGLGAIAIGASQVQPQADGVLRSSTGDIHLEGRSIVGLEPHRVVTRGIVMVPEGRHIFPNLTVRENLVMGGYSRRDREELEGSRRRVFDLFPILEQRQQQAASSLSGGEQQMLAISRALMASPRLLLLDEPSLGLAPLLVRSIFRVIKELAEQRVTILLVEQNVRQALRVADRAYVLEVGRLVHEWTREELMQEEASILRRHDYRRSGSSRSL